MTSSSTREQMNQVGTRVSDCEPSTVVIEIRLTRDEEIVHAHDQGIQVPTPDGRLSSLSTCTEESIERTIMPNVMPQLDGPASTHAQRSQPLPVTRRTAIPGGGFPDDSNSDSHDYRPRGSRGHSGRRRPYQERGGRPPDRDNNQDHGYPGRGGPPDDGGPSDGGGPPGNGRPPRRPPRGQGPPGPPGPPGPVRPIIVQQPQVTLDTTATAKYLWNSWPVDVAIG